MDHAPLLCSQIAQDKAYSVAASFGGLPASDEWRLLEGGTGAGTFGRPTSQS
jgi:uncharacterized protein GlcG (DUF336 family)